MPISPFATYRSSLSGKVLRRLLLAMLIKQRVLRDQPFVVSSLEGRLVTVNGADFCFGIRTNLEEAEVSLKNQKELRKTSQQR
jgi:hypothetical protein